MSNPVVNVAFKRGWWRSIIDALRDAGPEYAFLAADLQSAVDNADIVPLDPPHEQPVHGEKGPEPMVPRVIPHQDWSKRLTDMPPVTKATEIEPGKQYLIQVDEGRPMSQEIADRVLAKLKDRFPTNTFAIAGGFSVAEVGLPEAVYAPVVMQDDLVDAIKRAALEQEWRKARGEDKTAYWGAASALLALARALQQTPERDGAATPTPESSPRPSQRTLCSVRMDELQCILNTGHDGCAGHPDNHVDGSGTVFRPSVSAS